MKGIFLYTLGCKVNQYETQAIYEKFQKYGYSKTKLQDADIVVINTCTVTSRSDAKSRKFIRRAIAESPAHSCVVITGCLAEFDKDKIYDIDGVDMVLENRFKPAIASLITGKMDIEGIKDDKIPDLRISHFNGHARAFLKVQDGCDHNCSYCKVSLVRGDSRSRNIDDIINEARRLIDNEYKEIVLTGVCLGAYGLDFNPKIRIIDLIKKVSRLDGNFRVRLSSIEPNYVTEELLDFITEDDKVCNHLHLPLQSGDNRILELMKRPYRVEKITDIINYARSKDPYLSFSTDVIVGFPTEDDISIDNTISILKIMQPLRTHIFKFSARKGTAAHGLASNVTGSDKIRWHQKLLNVSDDMSLKFRSKFLGKKLNVLVEKEKNSNFKASGHSDNYIYIKANSDTNDLNGFVKIRVDKITQKDTFGVI